MQALAVEAVSGSDALLCTPHRFEDGRGSFCEIYNARTFAAAGIDAEFVQDNLSVSLKRGTIRGLHFQRPPAAQAKLVRVVSGAILDVVIDLRPGSPCFAVPITVPLDAGSPSWLYVPVGFAHGFCTLADNTAVLYKVTSYYAPEADDGIHWRDEDLEVPWPVERQVALLSNKDQGLPSFASYRARPAFSPYPGPPSFRIW